MFSYSKLSVFIILLCSMACGFFVTLCFRKFFRRDIGTRVNFIESTTIPFPSVTLCPRFGYKSNALAEFGLQDTSILVFEGSNGVPNDTSRMKEFIQKTTLPLEDILISVRVKTYRRVDGQYDHLVWNKNGTKVGLDWDVEPHRTHGMCYTGTLLEKYTTKGIAKVEITLEMEVAKATRGSKTKPFFITKLHHRGQLNRPLTLVMDIETNFQRVVKINLAGFKKLAHDNADCDMTMNTGYDKCWENAKQAKLQQELNCLFPWNLALNELSNDVMCQNASLYDPQIEARLLNELRDQSRLDQDKSKKETDQSCKPACHFTSFDSASSILTKLDSKLRHAVMVLEFDSQAQLTEEYYTYTPLNLLGETGGFFGLFLGISCSRIVSGIFAKLGSY